MNYDLIIIGGGPAGITAGIYAARQKLRTLLITKSFGGQIASKTMAVENYPGFEEISGTELIEKFEKHLRKQKIDIRNDEVIKVEKIGTSLSITTTSKKQFQAMTVIIASGADPRPLEIPGEKEFIGKGLSYCAVCDGALFPKKTVAVIGGGNTAFETAIFLSKIAKKIYILEYNPKVRADRKNQELVQKSGKIEIITNVAVRKIIGDKFIKGLVCEDKKTGKKINLPVEGVFVAIGLQPSSTFARGLVDLNEKDEIMVDFETCQTKTPGLFAAGDCNVGKFKQIVTAVGEGAKAALAAFYHIQKLQK